MDSSVDHRSYKRRERPDNGKHSYSDKMFALSVYAENMSQTEASQASGIPATTIAAWLKSDEIDATLENLRQALRSSIAHKCAQAAALSVDTVIERLQNGDWKLTKDGDTVRCPVSAKDAGYLAASMIDRHALLTGTSGLNGKANEALSMVADKLMAAIAQASTPKVISSPGTE